MLLRLDLTAGIILGVFKRMDIAFLSTYIRHRQAGRRSTMVVRGLIFSMVCTGFLEELLGSWYVFSTAILIAKIPYSLPRRFL